MKVRASMASAFTTSAAGRRLRWGRFWFVVIKGIIMIMKKFTREREGNFRLGSVSEFHSIMQARARWLWLGVVLGLSVGLFVGRLR